MYLFRDSTLKARREMTPTERLLDHQNSLYWWTNLGLGIAIVIGFLVIYFHGGNRTTAIAAFGASLGVGGVLGFLFGVPSNTKKTSDTNTTVVVPPTNNPQPLAPDSNPASVNPLAPVAVAVAIAAPEANPALDPSTEDKSQPVVLTPGASTSNLEQVADWVTKLLLGGGLTQMQRIPPKIWQWSHVVAVGILGDNPNINERLILSEQGFACGLLVYGFVLGFFAGFLITKLQLGKAIAE